MIVSHVVHYEHDGRLYAYGPYAREIDLWADLFPRVVIAAPCRHEPPPGDAIAFGRSNITMHVLCETGGHSLRAKLAQFAALPDLLAGLTAAMREADAIHVRCPGNLGLLGAILAPIYSQYLVAKYAGQWTGYATEPRSIRLQRAVLGSRWWRGPVTVYGDWPGQRPHVIPFFTSMMTSAQVTRAAAVAATRRLRSPLRVLFLGRLVHQKRVHLLLDAAHQVMAAGDRLDVAIVGEGPEDADLRERAARLGLQDVVRFVGSIPFDEALGWCEWADCLVLPSESEGWPKAIAEGMCYGLICVGMRRGQVPAMLDGRGIVLDEGSAEEIAGTLRRIMREPETFEPMARAASQWARQFSLEGLRDALAVLLARQWCVPEQTFHRRAWPYQEQSASIEAGESSAVVPRSAARGQAEEHGTS